MTMDGDQTRARLIAEARDLYLEQGFGRFSLREVARRVGVSAPAIYRHYDGKEALLGEVCNQGFRIFATYLVRALDAPTSEARLFRTADEYLRFALENPRDYRFIFMSAAEDAAALKPRETDKPDETFQFLLDRVEECMKARVLKRGPAEPTALTIWAHVHGLCSLRLSGLLAAAGSDNDFKRFYTHSVAQLLSGLGE